MSSLSIKEPKFLPNAFAHPRELALFEKVELVVLDLDGTLLSHSDDRPSSSNWEKRSSLVRRLKYWGIPLSLATGRAYAGAKDAMQAIKQGKGIPSILYNGSAVVSSDGLILDRFSIKNNTVDKIKNKVMAIGASATFYFARQHWTGLNENEWAVFAGHGQIPNNEFNGLSFTHYEAIPQDATCIAALLWGPTSDFHLRIMNNLMDVEGISLTTSGGKYVEVRPLGSSKAAGMEILLNHLQISKDNVMAVGDNDNDVELLEYAGIGVCVSNASSKAKNVSQYQTNHPSSSGTIEILDFIARVRRLSTVRVTKNAF